jgi:hypothetical protein
MRSADQQCERQQYAHGSPRAIDVEVTQRGQAVAPERPDDRDERGHARPRCHKLQERNHDHLRQIGQTRLAAVVLQVRVGRKTRHRVEGKRRLHVPDIVGIQR